MTYKMLRRLDKNRAGRLKKRLLLLLIFIPLFLLGASFFVFAAAQDNFAEQSVNYWNENRDSLIADYSNGHSGSDIAGVIYFDETVCVPFYFNLVNVEESASLYGSVLPGQSGRSIIMGHNDKEFAYLARLEAGDKIAVDSCEGMHEYVVISTRVVVPSEIPKEATDGSVLTLVSQYPFRAVSLASRRYVVEAIPVN
ncbi:MAG: sortase [Clostridia bacterium]|nr:sortase [Clostridia bacterium]